MPLDVAAIAHAHEGIAELDIPATRQLGRQPGPQRIRRRQRMQCGSQDRVVHPVARGEAARVGQDQEAGCHARGKYAVACDPQGSTGGAIRSTIPIRQASSSTPSWATPSSGTATERAVQNSRSDRRGRGNPTGMAILPRAFPWLLTAALAAQDAATLLPSNAALRPHADPTAYRRAMELPDLLVDEPGDGSVWARGRGYKAQIATTGLHFLAARGAQEALAVDFATAAVRIGNEALPQSSPTLTYRSGNCQLDHGAFVENFALRPEGVEQSWVFASLPLRDELTIDVAWSSPLPCRPDGDGHFFRAEDGSGIHYGSATAIDAGGKRLSLRTQCVADRLRIVVPQSFVAMAQLPLRIDPLVGSAVPIATNSTVDIGEPDLAFDESTNGWLLVWNQEFSGTDWDVYARRLNRNLTLHGAAFGIDLSSANWRRPRVANMSFVAQYLIVAQAGTPTGTIVGRRVTATGTAWPTQIIDGSSGCEHPDVGGDPFAGSTARYNVVWSRSGAIQSVTMASDGVFGTVRTLAAPGVCSRPSISKGNREAQWLVGFVSLGFGSAAVRVARIHWNGAVIADGANDSTLVAPLVGTAAASVAVSSPNQNDQYLVAWNDNDDIWVRATGIAPAWLTPPRNLQALEGGGTATFEVDRRPSVDTDGLRFAVAYAEGPPTGQPNVLVSTVALTATDLRVDEARVVVVGVPEFLESQPRVASPFASRRSNWTTIEEYGIAYALKALILPSVVSFLQVHRYDGYASSGGFTTFPSACGSPLSVTATGVPALGRTVSFGLAPVFPLAGFLFGTPDGIPLAPICSCSLGVNGQIVAGTSLVVTIPNNVSFVGQTVSCQGFSFASGPCFGTVSLSDTIDMRMR